MKPLETAAGTTLEWIRLSLWRMNYELRQGTEVCARLWWGVPLVGSTSRGTWRLTPHGRRRFDVDVAGLWPDRRRVRSREVGRGRPHPCRRSALDR